FKLQNQTCEQSEGGEKTERHVKTAKKWCQEQAPPKDLAEEAVALSVANHAFDCCVDRNMVGSLAFLERELISDGGIPIAG
ncbi:MAG: hypothetical protein ACRC10_03615, partial [Thermoguttaceae bacterium]